MIITPLFVLFNIIVFVLIFLFVSTIDKRKWLILLVSILLTPLVYFYAFYPFINIFSNYHHQKYFNSEIWIDKPELRYEMNDNMIESDTLIKRSKKEVQKLLGNYEWLGWDTELNTHNDDVWNYNLGIEPGAFNSMKAFIEIRFKNNEVVTISTFKEEITFETKN